jgi:hypothetical protein
LDIATIPTILAAKRIGGREEFHRRVFEAMLAAQRPQAGADLAASDAAVLLELLSRWIVEAPTADEFGVLRLFAVRSPLRDLVAATGTPYAAFLSKVLGLDTPGLQPGKLPAWKQVKLAALGDASLVPADALPAWSAASPVWARLAAIAALDTCPVQADAAEATAAVGRWLASVAPIDIPGRFLEPLMVSAFHVTYLADGDRHAFKRAIVRQAEHMVRQVPVAGVPAAGAGPGGKMRLTIVGELLFPQHAMFRCYAEALEGLRVHFHVTLVADAPTRCVEHQRISDAQAYFPPGERDLARLAGLVASTRPDIVLYPSIGMTYWTFALSLLRLAPLQLMGGGHPAPSCSARIDATLVYSEMAPAAHAAFGRVLAYDRQPLPAPPPGGWAAAGRTPGGTPVVAVNAAWMKLSPDFLAAVRSVLDAAPAGTTLQFFPNVSGPAYLARRRELTAMFPGAVVHPAAGYASYMEALSRSDLVLQSFPFGGTNTVMDALALGMPMVCMEAEDLAGAADPLLLRHAGLGDLVADGPDAYISLARALLADPAARERVRALAGAALPRLQQLQAPGARSMADAVLQAWRARPVP